jgi:hypothetical protein
MKSYIVDTVKKSYAFTGKIINAIVEVKEVLCFCTTKKGESLTFMKDKIISIQESEIENV